MHAIEAKSGFAASVLEYLRAVRDRVCSRCGGRPPGDPRGNPCGTVLPLEQLVEALEQGQARREGRPFPERAASHAGHCPCKMERLAVLAAEAAEDLEKQR
jgi:hypothetical protein